MERKPSGEQKDSLVAIDALRGYAILFVIAVHSIGHNRDLVWPVVRPLTLGFYGVQLFFMASALTLLMSWNRSNDLFENRSIKFLIRRFFRIAPLYYLAILFYWFAYRESVDNFSVDLLFSSLLFYNAWSPYFLPTVPGWTPVPGGWSIGVEFWFYFIFPFLATLVTSLNRSIVFFFVSFFVMIIASGFGAQMYPEITYEQRSNFLYFWPPNQLVIFSLGFVLYYLFQNENIKNWILNKKITSTGVSFVFCFTLFLLSFYGPRKFFDWSFILPPTHLLISLIFLPWALFLLLKPTGIVVNKYIVGLGRVSFSAYILHFAVLKYVGLLLKEVWPVGTDGVLSIVYSFILLLTAIVLTRYFGGLTYKYIEQPGISVGKLYIRRMGETRGRGA
jgi:peptidoglycan/LPS O-acetylase OafA/YrhL